MVVTHDGARAISAGLKSTASDRAELRVWDLQTQQCAHVLRHHAAEVTAMAVSQGVYFEM